MLIENVKDDIHEVKRGKEVRIIEQVLMTDLAYKRFHSMNNNNHEISDPSDLDIMEINQKREKRIEE